MSGILLDVDSFKRFDDTMLTRMAQLPRSRTRAGGRASRDGAEALTLVMPEATLDSTRVRAEHPRRALKQRQVHDASRVLGQAPLSLGVASFPLHGSPAQPLLHAADSALYTAQHGGRGRVAVAAAM